MLENEAQYYASRQHLIDALASEQQTIIAIVGGNGSCTSREEEDGGGGGGGGGGSAAEQDEERLDQARRKAADLELQVSSTEHKDKLEAAQTMEAAKQLGKAWYERSNYVNSRTP